MLITIAQVNTVRIYRIDPTSSASPHLILTALSAAIGSDGTVYYESGDHHLDALHPDGTTTQGPVLVDKPNGLGGGVQDIDTVAGGYVWVSEPAGQGLDAGYTTYAATSLAQAGTFSGSVTDSVTDTAAGPLVLEQGANGGDGLPAGIVTDVVRLPHRPDGLHHRPRARRCRCLAARPGSGRCRLGHHDRPVRALPPVLSVRRCTAAGAGGPPTQGGRPQ